MWISLTDLAILGITDGDRILRVERKRGGRFFVLRGSVLVQGEPEEDSFDYDPFVKFDKKRSVLVPGEPEEDSFDYDPFVKFDKRRLRTMSSHMTGEPEEDLFLRSVLLVPGEPAFEQDPFEKFDKRRSVLVQGEPEEDSFDYDPFVKFDKRRSTLLVQGEPEEDSFDYDPFVKFDKRCDSDDELSIDNDILSICLLSFLVDRIYNKEKEENRGTNPFCSIYGRRRRGDLITMLPVVVVVVSPFPATHKIEMYSMSRTNLERVKRFDTSLLLEDCTM
ncbi:hypothetical protein Tco_1555111 [Tanacetum coccineum]